MTNGDKYDQGCSDTRAVLLPEIERLRAALKPFANRVLPSMLNSNAPDDYMVARVGIELGKFRQAVAALNEQQLAPDEKLRQK